MKDFTRQLLPFLACLSTLALSASAYAQAVRGVVLVKHELDGKVRNAAPLETTAFGVLDRAGLRLVEIDAALASQKALFSDMVQAGTLPPALSLLNADALISLQLACDTNGGKLLGSDFQSYFCTLSTKVVRVDTGDVVFAASDALPAHGLNGAMALQALLKSKIPDVLDANSKEWLGAWRGAAGFNVDLLISGVSDRLHRDQLRELLNKLSGVSDVQAVYLRDGLAKFTVSGKGEGELRMLATAIEQSDLALRVTREAGRTLHAQVDAAKAYARPAVLYLELPGQGDAARSLIEEVGPDIVQTALRNLPYLSPLHSRPLAGGPRSAESIAKLVLASGSTDFALVVAARVRHVGGVWTSHLSVSDISGFAIGNASASGPDMVGAIEASAHLLDGALLAAYGKPEVRKRIGLREPGRTIRSPNLMVVERFQVRGERDGLLDLRNASVSRLPDCSVDLRVAGIAAGRLLVPDLLPGTTHTVPLSFASLPRGIEDEPYTNVSATIHYRAGEAYGDTHAEALWMREVRQLGLGPTKKPRMASDSETYDRLTQQGVAASRAGDWQRAKTLFTAAHKQRPTARTLRALGMVSFDLGDYEQAQRYLRDALASTVIPLTPTMQAQVGELLERATSESKRKEP